MARGRDRAGSTGGQGPAPIGEAREEILRLIAKLQRHRTERRPGAGDTPARGGAAGAPPPEPARGARPAGEVTGEIRSLRQRLEERLGEAHLAVRLQALEQRTAQLEQLVSGRAAARGAAPPSSDEHLLAGELRGQLMPDMLQLVSSNGLTGVFVVTSDGNENRLYFEEGQVCHADGPGVEGESAFFAAMALEEGRYHFHETTDLPAARTISGNTQFLILEALRQIDEKGGP